MDTCVRLRDAARVIAQVRACSRAQGDGERFSAFKCAGDTQFTGSAEALTDLLTGDARSPLFTGKRNWEHGRPSNIRRMLEVSS